MYPLNADFNIVIDNSSQLSVTLNPDLVSAPHDKKTRPPEGGARKLEDAKQKKTRVSSNSHCLLALLMSSS